ncbi:hypothetical protein HNR64_003277 [Spongiibacter marinus]|nr:hypothetical protein [Spongiibacter marinus]
MIDDADGECVVLHSDIRTARKAHKCNECHRNIEGGEPYLNECTVFEGSKETHKTCQHCQVIRKWLTHECGGFVYGQIYSDIEEHAWEGYGMAVGRMVIGMRKKWRTKAGTLLPLPQIPSVSGHDIAA